METIEEAQKNIEIESLVIHVLPISILNFKKKKRGRHRKEKVSSAVISIIDHWWLIAPYVECPDLLILNIDSYVTSIYVSKLWKRRV